MSVDDPDKKPLNQTRFGTPTGHANERAMLDSRNDTFGIRTIIKRNGDGSETMCRTHAGMPRFITEEEPAGPNLDTCPLTDVGFVNSAYSVGAYPPSERFDWKLYTLFDGTGAVKTAKYARNSIPKKEQLMWNAASLYSGLMRRVVQLHNGKADETTPLQHGWEATDGLFIGVGNYGVITRYVIRIDSSGVWRIPIKFCKDLTPTWQTDEATWISELTEQKAHDKIAPYWTIKKLSVADKVQIGAAPSCYTDGTSGYAPFYDWCGWAFNYDGTKATVVCTGFASMDALYQTNRMYDLTISHEAGVPTGASVVMTESGAFVNPANDSTPGAYNAALQVPSVLPGYLATYQFYNPTHGIPNQDTPVYSYYESSGAKIVVRFKYTNGTTIATTRTIAYQTPVACYQTPIGTFQSTTFVNGFVEIQDFPQVASGAFNMYSLGKVYDIETGGMYGKYGPGVSSAHVHFVGETHSTPEKTELELEDAGIGEVFTPSHFLAGRMPSPRATWCVTGWSIYGDDKPYFPWPNDAGGSGGADLLGRTRYVQFIWQKTTTYGESAEKKSVLVLHGFDREAYAVATYDRYTTTEKTSSGSTAGPIANFSCMPIGPTIANVWENSQPFSPTMNFGVPPTGGTVPVQAIGGYDLFPSDDGMVCCMGQEYSAAGSFGPIYTPAQNNESYTLYNRVGETTFVSFLSSGSLLKNYVDGDMFLFRALSSAWDNSRVVRSLDANSSLKTENLGGVEPTSNITTFIGVF